MSAAGVMKASTSPWELSPILRKMMEPLLMI